MIDILRGRMARCQGRKGAGTPYTVRKCESVECKEYLTLIKLNNSNPIGA